MPEPRARTVGVGFGAATDIGSVRSVNQDSVLAAEHVFAVADGMGGHAAGEVASALAVAELSGLGARDDVGPDDIRATVARANAAILARVAESAETAGMGTTLTGVTLGVLDGEARWLVFNVGDSRVYRFADGELSQLTTDHSEVAELVQAGVLSDEEARHYPRRNVITRSLGSDPAPVPDIWALPLERGVRFLVCSDGLPLEVDEAQMAEVLGAQPDPQLAADDLVSRAVQAGGRDNVSVIVVESAPEWPEWHEVTGS